MNTLNIVFVNSLSLNSAFTKISHTSTGESKSNMMKFDIIKLIFCLIYFHLLYMNGIVSLYHKYIMFKFVKKKMVRERILNLRRHTNETLICSTNQMKGMSFLQFNLNQILSFRCTVCDNAVSSFYFSTVVRWLVKVDTEYMNYIMPMTLHYIPIYFLLLSTECRWSYLCDWITLISSLLYNL